MNKTNKQDRPSSRKTLLELPQNNVEITNLGMFQWWYSIHMTDGVQLELNCI